MLTYTWVKLDLIQALSDGLSQKESVGMVIVSVTKLLGMFMAWTKFDSGMCWVHVLFWNLHWRGLTFSFGINAASFPQEVQS